MENLILAHFVSEDESTFVMVVARTVTQAQEILQSFKDIDLQNTTFEIVCVSDCDTQIKEGILDIEYL